MSIQLGRDRFISTMQTQAEVGGTENGGLHRLTLSDADKRVYTIVNYDNFTIHPELIDRYTGMVKYLVDTYYHTVTRYTTSAFNRMKMKDAFEKKNLDPSLYETREEAERALKQYKDTPDNGS